MLIGKLYSLLDLSTMKETPLVISCASNIDLFFQKSVIAAGKQVQLDIANSRGTVSA
jgi:hypothetical protein